MGKKKKSEKGKKHKEKEEKLLKPDKKEKQRGTQKQSKPEKQPESEKQSKPEKQPGSEKQSKPEKRPASEKQSKPEKRPASEKQSRPEKRSESEKQSISALPVTNIVSAEAFRALGDESRMQILELLKDREMCAGDLLKSLSIVQSTFSHHIKILVEAGIVRCRRQGKWSYYSIDKETLKRISTYIMKWS